MSARTKLAALAVLVACATAILGLSGRARSTPGRVPEFDRTPRAAGSRDFVESSPASGAPQQVEWIDASPALMTAEIDCLKRTTGTAALFHAARRTTYRPVFFYALAEISRLESEGASPLLTRLARDRTLPRERRLHAILAIHRRPEPSRSRSIDTLARPSEDPWLDQVLGDLASPD